MRKATLWLIATGILLVGVLAVQYRSTQRVASEVAALRQQLAVPAEPVSVVRQRPALVPADNAAILQRLTALEETVAQLVRNSEYLMEKGQLPVNTNKAGERMIESRSFVTAIAVKPNAPAQRSGAVLGGVALT
jgi:hypothetical protein